MRTVSNAPSTEPGKGVIAKRGLSGFLRDTMRELKHVVWPSRKETIRLSGVVLTVCTGIVLFLYALGIAFGWVLDTIIGKN